MMRTLHGKLFTGFFVAVFGLLLVLGVAANAQAVEVFDACNEPSAANSPVCQAKNTPVPFGGPNGILAKAIDVLSFITGFAGVLILVWGGMNYVTANGEGQKAARAKDTILFAVIGLILASSAQLISIFLIKRPNQ